LPIIRTPVSVDELRYHFRGTSLCSSERCEDAGGRCLSSYNGQRCVQHTLFDTWLRGLPWSSAGLTWRACRDCKCKRRGSNLSEDISGIIMLASPDTEHCSMYSGHRLHCNRDECEGAGGRCVLEDFGHCTLETPANIPAACIKCRCKRKNRPRNTIASG
jgi:hypothetical protein